MLAASYYLPRALHPGAWWLWALGLAAAASRTMNLAVLGTIAAVVVLVVLVRRGNAPWALSFRLYVVVACLIVVLRVVFCIVFVADGGHVLFTLPELRLPGPFAAWRLFGPVSVEGLLAGLRTGAQLGLMVLCVGAANSMTSPKRLLAAVPGALYEFGTIAIVTLSAFPQLAESVQRVNRARLLRDAGGGARHVIRQVFMPVLADALDRSLCLAGAMDSRGYGRTNALPARVRLATNAALLGALLALGIGLYGLLNGQSLLWVLMVAGFVLGGVFLHLAGRRAVRTRYRPDRWGAAEWLVSLCGLVPAAALIWRPGAQVAWLLVVALVGALPVLFAPPQPEGAQG